MSGFNQLQFTKSKWHSGMTEQNHLAQALLTQPEVLTKTIAYAFGPKKYALGYLTQGMGHMAKNVKAMIGNRQYRWPLMGMLAKAIPIIGLVSGGSTPGINRSTFIVEIAEKHFSLGDILVTDGGYQFRVQTDPTPGLNGGWNYTCQLSKPDPTLYIPSSEFERGKQLSKGFTAVEEYSNEAGSFIQATPFWFENQLTTVRSTFSMSGGAQTDVMVLQIGGPGRKGSMLWMYEQEYQHMLQWNDMCEWMMWYSEYNRDAAGQVHLPGENGRPVLIGAGVHEQIAPSNRRTYTVLTENLIREFLNDLQEQSYNSDSKKWVAFCGWWFFDAFDRAMKSSIQRYTLVDSKFITGSGQELTLGGQFVSYKGLNGNEITLVHNPMYDNPVRNRKLHPVTGKPLESYRATFLDFGQYGGESNIAMVAKGADGIDRSMLSWFTAGSQTPSGGDAGAKGYTSAMRSNALDGWACHFLSEKGIRIINPLSCGMLECVAE